MRSSSLLALALSPLFGDAIRAPRVDGLKLTFEESFEGCQGCMPAEKRWDIRRDISTNDEHQEYTASSRNIQLTGGDSLQLVPWRDAKGHWTSGRIETKGRHMAGPGQTMRVQASIRMGDAAKRQGMWPAFWMLGDSMRHGTEWPLCGEIDIFEQVNGAMLGHGSVHCGAEKGGHCNEPSGLRKEVPIPDNQFHDWSVVVDRSSNDWKTETITWFMDGNQFHQLSGAGLGDEAVWATLAHSPLFILLNVAVGGNWPGNPAKDTESGYGNMMEVNYVAVYHS